MGSQVPCRAVNDGHGGIRVLRFLHEQGRERLADDVAPPRDDHVLPGGRVAAAHEELDDPGGRRGREPRTSDQDQAHVLGVETVHVLPGVDGLDRRVHGNLGREGLLDQDAVDLGIRIQLLDRAEQLLLRRVLGHHEGLVGHAHLLAGLALHLHVELRAGVVADQDGREAGDHSTGAEPIEAVPELAPDLVRHALSVDDVARHGGPRRGETQRGHGLWEMALVTASVSTRVRARVEMLRRKVGHRTVLVSDALQLVITHENT